MAEDTRTRTVQTTKNTQTPAWAPPHCHHTGGAGGDHCASGRGSGERTRDREPRAPRTGALAEREERSAAQTLRFSSPRLSPLKRTAAGPWSGAGGHGDTKDVDEGGLSCTDGP
uniref:Uncharacterized protein n=1 Tax=Knipowitschia caucasica TaxID=637954 RepID=A0AAV2LN67_KNICA